VPYIGKQLVRGQNRKLDDISSGFNGSQTTFTLQVASQNVTVGSALQLWISLGGVIQEPTIDYTIAGNQITFTTAPAASLDFFGVIQGDVTDTNTPGDATVTTSKLATGLTVNLADGSAATSSLQLGGTDSGLFSSAADKVNVTTGGVERLEIGDSEVVFNDPSNDVDFRVESNGNANMLFVDGGNDRVGIATGSPSAPFHLNAGTTNNALFVDSSDAEVSIGLAASDGAVRLLQSSGGLVFRTNGNANAFGTGDSEAARIDSSGRLLVGTSTARNKVYNGTTSVNVPQFQTEVSGSGVTSRAMITGNPGTNTSEVGPALILARSTGTTDNSYTAVTASANHLGQVSFQGADGSEFVEAARIEALVDGTPGANDMPGRLVFSTNSGSSSTTERVRISSNGAVGIGTTSNSNRLRIHEGSDTPNVVIVTGADESSEFLALGIDSGLPCVTAGGVSSTSASLGFRVSDNGTESEAARFDKDGRLLIGISSVIDSNSTVETYKASGQNHVRVQSNSLANGEYAMFRAHGIANTNTRQAFIGVYKHSGITNAGPFLFLEAENGANANYWTDNSGNFRTSGSSAHIGTTSGTVVGTQTSDLRLKNVGANVSYGLAEIKQLQPKQYALKTNPDVNKLGFIAQEVESIIPEAVFDTNEELDGHQEGDRTKLGMEYVQLIPVLVNAIKELSAEVDTLKTKVAALEAE